MKFFSSREKFYDLFEELADKLVEGVKLFTEILGNYEYSEFKVGKLKEIEHEADHITHQVYKRMHKVFLTPLDREDIFALANKLDSVLDEVESAAVRMYLYRMKKPAKELLQITAVLTEAVAKIQKIIFSVRKKEDAPLILKLCVEINTLENEGDQLFRLGDGAAFRGGKGRHRAHQGERHHRPDRKRRGQLRGRLQHHRRDRPEIRLATEGGPIPRSRAVFCSGQGPVFRAMQAR